MREVSVDGEIRRTKMKSAEPYAMNFWAQGPARLMAQQTMGSAKVHCEN